MSGQPSESWNKNPDPATGQDHMGYEPDVVLCTNPFSKHLFLESVVDTSDCGVIYLDFDLLYSGYVSSGMTDPPTTVSIRHPSRESWNAELTNTLHMISQERYLVILDSLNTLSALWSRSGSKHLAACSVMLMSSLGRKTGTRLLVAAVGRQTKDGWELLPGGRFIPGLNARTVSS